MFIWDHFLAGYLNCEKKELCNISLKCCLHCFNDCYKARCLINVTCTCNLFLIIYYSIIFVLMYPYTSFVTLIFFLAESHKASLCYPYKSSEMRRSWLLIHCWFSRAHLMCRSTIEKTCWMYQFHAFSRTDVRFW